jgi:hypothetical protein
MQAVVFHGVGDTRLVELEPPRSKQREKTQEAPARSRRHFDEEARA